MKTSIGLVLETATRSLTSISVTDNVGTAPVAVKTKISDDPLPASESAFE